MATATYSDHSTKDVTTSAAWSSSASIVATVGAATGLVTAVKVGTVVITASYSGVAGTASLNATAATLMSIAVTAPKANMALGTMQQLKAIGTYSDGTMQDVTTTATWTSATPTQVSVSNAAGSQGIATASLATTAPVSITASLAAKSGSAPISVTSATLSSIAITPATATIAPKATLPFSATGTFSDSSIQDITLSVTWSTSNSTAATISPQGLATAGTGFGTTMIGATASAPLLPIAATPVTLTVSTTVYAYATNFDAGTVSQYQIGAGGALTSLGADIAAGVKPFSVSVEPTGQFVYVANYGSNSASQYKIGPSGMLTAIGAGTVATGVRPNGVARDHANKFAYVANFGDSTVSQYSIGSDGTLIPLTPGTVTNTGKNPATIVLDPTDHYAYVANFGVDAFDATGVPGTLSQYRVDLTNHTLTPMSPAATVPSGSGPDSIAITGNYLYVANSADNNVSQYLIGSDGTLAAIPLSAPATLPVGKRPVGLAVDPTGKYLYVANSTDGTVGLLTINPTDGSLTAGPAVAAGLGVSSVTIDPSGAYLYATNRGTMTVSQFSIGAGGMLTAIAGSPVAAGLHPTSIATGY